MEGTGSCGMIRHSPVTSDGAPGWDVAGADL
jgi:hypothetical protein